MKIRISEINCRAVGDGKVIASLTIRVKDVAELNAVCARIRTVSGVEQVRRGKS